MQINFRQGIIGSRLVSGVPDFLTYNNGTNSLDINITTVPIRVTAAFGVQNFLIEQTASDSNAWGPLAWNTTWGPQPTNASYHVYWDINIATGYLSKGFTHTLPTISATTPLLPAIDQHWFDSVNTKMMVWNGLAWTPKCRVFAGSYYPDGIGLSHQPLGTQVNLSGITQSAGYIMYGNDARAIRFGDGTFLTSESDIIVRQGGYSSPVRLESLSTAMIARVPISAFTPVCVVDNQNGIGLATSNDIVKRAIGFTRIDLAIGEVTSVITEGQIFNQQWNWDIDLGKDLFLGLNGQIIQGNPGLQTSPQKVGVILTPQSILVSIQEQSIASSTPEVSNSFLLTSNSSANNFKITNHATPTAATDVATKGYADGLVTGFVKADGSVAMTGALALGANRITGVATPTAATDAATKGYVDAASGGSGALAADGSIPMSGALSLGANRITGVATPTAATDAATKGYADGLVTGAFTADRSAGGFKLLNVATPTAATDAATKGYADGLVTGFVKADGSVAMTGALALGANRITGVATPTAGTDAATKGYADGLVTGFVKADGSVAMTGALALGANRITGVATPTAATDAATKGYADGLVTGAFTADRSAGGFKLLNVATPTLSGDTANKGYVDAAIQTWSLGLPTKKFVRVASGATNINLAAPGAVIDGVTIALNDEFLAKDQTLPAENGPYVWNGPSVPATRRTDFNTSALATPGITFYVSEGSPGNTNKNWVLTTDAPITLGVTPLTFATSLASGTGDIRADGTVSFAANQSMGGFKLQGLATATLGGDAVNKTYADNLILGLVNVNGSAPFTSNQSMGGFKLTNVATPTAATDAATKAYADGLISGLIKADASVSYTAAQNFGGFQLFNVADPTSNQNAATKAYVDNVSGHRVFTNAAATGAITLNCSLYDVFNLTLTGNVTVTLTGATFYKSINIRIKQDATGSRTWTFTTPVRFPTGVVFVPSTAANALDKLGMQYDSIDDRYDLLASANAIT